MNKINEYLKRDLPNKKLISGFDGLDNIIDSFDNSNLYILGGSAGMGKTSFGLFLVHHLALNLGANVGVVSYEMNHYQIGSRLLAISSKVPNDKILYQKLDNLEIARVEKSVLELGSANIFIDCPATLDFDTLRNNIIESKGENNIDFLFIDDIHRITISENDRKYAANREQEVSKNVRDLKSLAKEIDIPILAISQLNRNNKDRFRDKPILSDIRDSGAIENDSDVVILLQIPEHFNITEDEYGNSLRGISDFVVAKNRHGPTGGFRLYFEKDIPCYHNIESKDFLDNDKFSSDNSF